MSLPVVFAPDVETDIADLLSFIATAGGIAAAERFVGHILATCASLGELPYQGTRCDALLPGLRTFGWRRRATIAFRVMPDHVAILAILYGGRDLATAMRDRGLVS